MKSVKYFFALLMLWLVTGQSCMRMRTSDTNAMESFNKAGVPLTIKNIKADNRNLHFVLTGNDSLPTIVFVHGSPGSWDAFEEYLKDKDLLKQYRMVSIDRPGFGYSNFGEALNLEDESKVISAIFPFLNNKNPLYLVGHSLGGPMIVQLAADNPDFINALVILSGAIDVSLEKPEQWRKVMKAIPLRYIIPGALRPSNDELWYLKKDLLKLKSIFSTIKCPVYIMHGDKDPLVDYGNLAFGAKAFSNAAEVDTITIVGANHFIPWKRYDEIKKVLLKLKNVTFKN